MQEFIHIEDVQGRPQKLIEKMGNENSNFRALFRWVPMLAVGKQFFKKRALNKGARAPY